MPFGHRRKMSGRASFQCCRQFPISIRFFIRLASAFSFWLACFHFLFSNPYPFWRFCLQKRWGFRPASRVALIWPRSCNRVCQQVKGTTAFSWEQTPSTKLYLVRLQPVVLPLQPHLKFDKYFWTFTRSRFLDSPILVVSTPRTVTKGLSRNVFPHQKG